MAYNDNSIEVKCFDEKKVQKELENCPKIVQDYVKSLKKTCENWKYICKIQNEKLQTNKDNHVKSENNLKSN